MQHAVWIALLSLIVTACRSAAAPDAPSAPAPTTVVRGAHTAIRGERAVVVRNADDWEELWREHTSAQLATAVAPKVDFEREMVVGVVLATCPSGGYAVEIVRAERLGDRWRVVAHRTCPPEGSMQTAVLTKPFHFVALPKSDAPIEFAWE
ncbi:MAG: protease complex subunit PrcB family protein [Planctomycetes bacterium]|nr:protease complex subunit PrcB family protein [Planctomycetota bacterium]